MAKGSRFSAFSEAKLPRSETELVTDLKYMSVKAVLRCTVIHSLVYTMNPSGSLFTASLFSEAKLPRTETELVTNLKGKSVKGSSPLYSCTPFSVHNEPIAGSLFLAFSEAKIRDRASDRSDMSVKAFFLCTIRQEFKILFQN